MGGRKAGFNISRSEFMPENAMDGDIEYQRTGGCFVTTKKAIALVVLAILTLAAVGGLIYFYGIKTITKQDDISSDIENLLNESLNNISDSEELRLPSYIQPLHYRLRIHPYLDEPNSGNFTFTGRVTILIQCTKLTKQIIFNSDELHIYKDEVKLATTKSLRLRSLSQVSTNLTNGGNSTFNNVPDTSFNNQNSVASQSNANETFNNKTNVKFNIPTSVPPAENAPNILPVSTTTSPAVPAIPITAQPFTIAAVATVAGIPTTSGIPTVAGIPIGSEIPPIARSPSVPAATSPIELNTNNSNADLNKSDITNINFNSANQSNNNIDTTIGPFKLPSSTKYTSLPDSVYRAAKIIRVDIKSQEENKKTSRYTLHLVNALQPGVNYTLDIKFSGKILNNLLGLYKTNYLDAEGRKRWLVTTQFQPIFARRVFPCFDEPSFKSTFEISVARRTNMTALSNMPLKDSEPVANKTGWVWDHFEKSPPMSTFLVAFTVCDFENLKPPSAGVGPVFQIWAPKQSIANAQYAVEIGPKILSYLQNYLGVKYPLSKIDLVAIPELSRFATENWGLISFRDTALLLDSNSDSWETRNHIFKTIARKLTNQWFGNLVTMDWWSDLWLSEGFSTYMEDTVENAIEPALEDLDTFALRITQAILDSDKLKSVRSLHVDIKDPTQIEQLFDDVTSNKGSCLIRMLNYTLSEALFKEGVQNYLNKWMYKCSNQDNFWDSLTEVSTKTNAIPSDLSIKTIMESWIHQEGYPVVTVTRDYNTGNALINQSRFVHGNATHSNIWYIPLTYTRQFDNEAVSTMWLKKEEYISTVKFMQPGNNTWVIFNVEQAGFYRVNYDITNWKLLQNQLLDDPAKIMPSNRGQLLNDAFELANAGLLDYKMPFELTKYLGLKERNYVPWYSVYHSLQTLKNHIGRTQYNGIFQQYIVKITKPVYDELGTSEMPGETQNNKLLRKFVIKVACSNNYEPCLQWAKQKYQEWVSSPDPDKNNPIPFDFRETVQCSAIKMGGQKEWEFLWQRTLYPGVSPTNLKLAYLTLGCTREPWLINSYLEKSLNGSVAIQNVRHVWKSIGHPVGLNVGFTFLRMNWDRIYKTNEHIFSNLKSIFEDFLSKLSTETDLEDLTLFYKNHKENLYPVSQLILSVVDRIKWRIYWRTSHMEALAIWLVQNN